MAASRVDNFLLALFKNTADVLADASMGIMKTDRITNFRACMAKGQSMNSTGEWRRVFYDRVIDQAQAQTVRCASFLFLSYLLIQLL